MRSCLIIGTFAFWLFLAGTASCQEANNGGSAADGGSCKVTSGPNVLVQRENEGDV
jgi:hypothetical protein